ncbi:Ap4A phosphorylase II [Gloeothece citriformis PCC 7424]|uniref:Ap4A phosphorylase II n=1 Tax=Gloeothece citriformis (strain PCC 7424) TaxID=65393 RepID=B7KAZ9_GLOC7|nr:phosphorylase [Gloeothece citriformis]ACK70109.1 Ap4A phosphorylase II [Gloeothece citriformis PCC 7424]
MSEKTIILESGTLWTKVREQTQKALELGALQPILTDSEFIKQDDITFLVRIVSNLTRKDKAQKQSQDNKEFNPFLPYDEDLFVCDISQTHLCLLNKYNVIDYHLLIVTRLFEEQDTWLTRQDFEALWATLAEIDGLAFYNGGKLAGASQRHKHLQLIPLPLAATEDKIPISPVIASTIFESDVIGKSPMFPFVHAIAQFNRDWLNSPVEAAEKSLHLYYQLLKTVGLIEDEIKSQKQTAPYNLLATREWMMIVPRSLDSFQSISVNSLGFAGALLARNSEQMQLIKELKPLTILQNVALNF